MSRDSFYTLYLSYCSNKDSHPIYFNKQVILQHLPHKTEVTVFSSKFILKYFYFKSC